LILIRHYTDPGCPWAFSAERRRLRLLWLYGGQIDWELRMMARDEPVPPADAARIAHGMPVDPREKVRTAPSIHACRAVVAVRLRWPDREAAMLRRLRVLNFAGELLDDSDTLELAAEQAGLPVAELAAFADAPEVHAALAADMQAAQRYPSPSYVLTRGDRRVELHGLQEVEDCEAAIADLAPELTRRPDPGSVGEVLAWAGVPLATAEVAAVCDREIAGVRGELARAARFEPVGHDGYWSM
jgi:predicted DsbA family dithiol-disulfide isomerase